MIKSLNKVDTSIEELKHLKKYRPFQNELIFYYETSDNQKGYRYLIHKHFQFTPQRLNFKRNTSTFRPRSPNKDVHTYHKVSFL